MSTHFQGQIAIKYVLKHKKAAGKNTCGYDFRTNV